MDDASTTKAGRGPMEGEELDAVWRALSDPTRRGLLDELRDRPRSTGELVECVPRLTRFAVMKHLGVLESAGLITVRREGRRRLNHLNAVPLRRVYERWVGRYADRWAGSLLSLRDLAETQAANEGDTPMGTEHTNNTLRAAVVTTEVEIAADRARVFDLFFERTRDWFYENEADRETRPWICERELGGRFYERSPGEGGDADPDLNLLGVVTMIRPNRKIRLKGDCTLPQAFTANMTVSFEDHPVGGKTGTRVSIEHRMAGEFGENEPKEFEEGWLDGLVKLKALAESESR